MAISIDPVKARASLKADTSMKVEIKLTDSSSLSTSYETTFKIVLSDDVANSTSFEGTAEGSDETVASSNDTETTDEESNDEGRNDTFGT